MKENHLPFNIALFLKTESYLTTMKNPSEIGWAGFKNKIVLKMSEQAQLKSLEQLTIINVTKRTSLPQLI